MPDFGNRTRERSAAMTTIAVYNQKGGVGKTTTAINLLAGIARRGRRPLGIDLDPQSHLTDIFEADVDEPEDSVYSVFADSRPLLDVALLTPSGLAMCPAHQELVKIDALLGKSLTAISRLNSEIRASTVDLGPIVIDCSPHFGVLTLNALFASDLLIVPVSADYLSMKSAQHVERTLNLLEPVMKRRLPRRYLLTRFDARRRMAHEIAEQMLTAFRPNEVCRTRIAESVALAESPAQPLDIFRHAPGSRGANDYQALVDELVGYGFIQ
jgi:chromosome partitioning protein